MDMVPGDSSNAAQVRITLIGVSIDVRQVMGVMSPDARVGARTCST
jgi:hypothetical protein